MADQKRWFKVWTSITANAHFAEMSLEDIGRWVLLGAAMALDGDNGCLEVPSRGTELCRLLRVPTRSEALATLMRWPSVYVSDERITWPHGHEKPPVSAGTIWRGGTVVSDRGDAMRRCRGGDPLEEWCTRYDTLFVTWKNWKKYQEDSTVAQRMKTLRSKRRREERRREENPPVAPLSSQGSGTGRNEVQVDEAVRKYQPLEAYRLIDVRQAVLNCQNWCVTRKKALTDRRLGNWLNSEAMKAASAPSRTKSPDPYAKFPRVSEGS